MALTSARQDTTVTLEPLRPTSLSTSALWVITVLKEPSYPLNALTVNSLKEELDPKLVAPSVTQVTTVSAK